MSGITAVGSTFNEPNYHGELIALTPTETPLLSAAGGVGGPGSVTDTTIEWQTFDLRDPEIAPALEGADAPAAQARVRSNVTNRVQIFHKAVGTTYTKQAAVNQYQNAYGGTPNPVTNEHSWQVMQELKQLALDVNFSFWNAVRNDPSDNTTARQMAGLLSVMTSNAKLKAGSALTTGASAATDTITATHDMAAGDMVVFTSVGASTTIRPRRKYWVKSVTSTTSFKIVPTEDLTATAIAVGTATVSFYQINAANTVTTGDVNELLQSVYDHGGISEQGTATLFVPSGQKRTITKAYRDESDGTALLGGTRNVGGVSVDTIITDFGTLNIAIDRHLPADALAVVSVEQLQPVFLSIPGKGVLFEEELAKTGATEKSQIYGEIGLKYGNEASHGVIRGLFA
ncbi:MAG TPA: DUF5309 family protein [Jiangellaceae bacterium]